MTYSPRARYGNKTGTRISEDHPGRHVMATGEPEVGWGTQVRGNIMNAMIPVRRNGEVIGYIWANELTDDIDRQALAMDVKIIAVIALGILFSLLIIIVFPVISAVISVQLKAVSVISLMTSILICR